MGGKKVQKKRNYSFKTCIRQTIRKFAKKRGDKFRYQVNEQTLNFFNEALAAMARRISERAMHITQSGKLKTTSKNHMLLAMNSFEI